MPVTPWRQIAVPHDDVLNGTSLQSDFAADLNSVAHGKAKTEYQDAKTFYERTYITEGMSQLLKNVILRLCGKNGEPVIQLKTSFGGGKTHSMIAVYHLATRTCNVRNLQGISQILDEVHCTEFPTVHAAVIDGNALSAGQAWTRGKYQIHTLWGELAWQLGGEEAYLMLKESDENGTSPGKELLSSIVSKYAPCVVLIDELLAFMRVLADGKELSAGTYNSNLSFIQALTEAVKLVPNAVMLASLPNSEAEVGDEIGNSVLIALEKYFGRIQAIWKPVEVEESFEIVRRRLFKTITDEKAKDEVCRQFYDMYVAESTKLPSETQQASYLERLKKCYPIHPQLFDCLYQDWSGLQKFQKTRGVLKLLSQVISTLWRNDNTDALILPASLPLADSAVRDLLISNLNGSGWEQVIIKDIDGPSAESLRIESEDSRFGKFHAAVKTARTIFFKTAPMSSTGDNIGNTEKGVSTEYILLGCLQPEENSAAYADAISKLADRLYYISKSGNKHLGEKKYYRFSTQANLHKEMEDRRNERMRNDAALNNLIQEKLKELTDRKRLFAGVHVFTSFQDVPDDEALRLVLLPPTKPFSKTEGLCFANDAVKEYLEKSQRGVRVHKNRLIFVAMDSGEWGNISRLAASELAWKSIIDDVNAGRFNIDQLQLNDAKTELATVKETFVREVASSWKHVMCPTQQFRSQTIDIDQYAANTSSSNYIDAIENACIENEFVITKWAAVHLNRILNQIYWSTDNEPVKALNMWNDCTCYLYMPRLQNQRIFDDVVISAAGTQDYFATAQGVDDNGNYVGFKFGESPWQVDTEMLLIQLDKAKEYLETLEQHKSATVNPAMTQPDLSSEQLSSHSNVPDNSTVDIPSGIVPPPLTEEQKAKHLFAEFTVEPQLIDTASKKIYDEVLQNILNDPSAQLNVKIMIEAEFPNGAGKNVRRVIDENLKTLKADNKDWS
jgi:predicted AAA+ superfamily ATPase